MARMLALPATVWGFEIYVHPAAIQLIRPLMDLGKIAPDRSVVEFAGRQEPVTVGIAPAALSLLVEDALRG